MMKLIIAVAILVAMLWIGVGVKYYLDNKVELVELDPRVTFDGAIDKKKANLHQWEIRTLNYAASKNEGLLERIYILINPVDAEEPLTENSTLVLEMFLTLGNKGSVEIPKRQIRRSQLAESVYNVVESQTASLRKLQALPELKDKNITRVIN